MASQPKASISMRSQAAAAECDRIPMRERISRIVAQPITRLRQARRDSMSEGFMVIVVVVVVSVLLLLRIV